MNLLRQLTSVALTLLTVSVASAQTDGYKPAGDRIRSRWAQTVTPENVWKVYPRPQLKRAQWENLNGLWNYAVTPADAPKPEKWTGEILVPFAYESSLSGVGGKLGADSLLWYSRTFSVPEKWRGSRVMLNFGAVDWKCRVWVNGKEVGEHTGGYAPFSFDITDALKKGENTLTVSVYDPSDKGYQPRGKQIAKPHGIWYSPVSGIWQTVWLEPVGNSAITDLFTTTDIKSPSVTLHPTLSTLPEGGKYKVKVSHKGKEVSKTEAPASAETVTVKMPADTKLWTPDTPELYDIEIILVDKKGTELDKATSYTALREFGMATDTDGHKRLTLNGKPRFQFGPLDQGWWPDGLYTAPSPEALAYDIIKTKDFGFNMIRKHVKVEPALWYQLCDSLGVIVWQDMPSGDRGPGWNNKTYFEGVDGGKRTQESMDNFRREWREIMSSLRTFPSIAVWIPFNESWGQFDTEAITAETKQFDPTRLVNPASGGNFFRCGDILDLHNYPEPDMYLYDPERANVMGEYGGIGLPLQGHLWKDNKNWGYVKFQTPDEVTDEYIKYAGKLAELIAKGFTGAIYTQTTDVEGEVNGLITYDREVVKIDEPAVKAVNQAIVNSLQPGFNAVKAIEKVAESRK